MMDLNKYNNIFTFYNVTIEESNGYVNLDLWGFPYTWINDLLDYSEIEIIEIFDYIRKYSNWYKSDILVASNGSIDIVYDFIKDGKKINIYELPVDIWDIDSDILIEYINKN